jgi:hypothetical protein
MLAIISVDFDVINCRSDIKHQIVTRLGEKKNACRIFVGSQKESGH